MTLLNEVDQPGSDVEVYVKGLDQVLLKKIEIITGVREKLLNFYSHLKTEEHMSKLYEKNKELATQTEATSNAQYDQFGDIINGINDDISPPQDNLLDLEDGALDDDLDLLN